MVNIYVNDRAGLFTIKIEVEKGSREELPFTVEISQPDKEPYDPGCCCYSASEKDTRMLADLERMRPQGLVD